MVEGDAEPATQIVLGRAPCSDQARAKGGGAWMNPELRLGGDVHLADLIAWWAADRADGRADGRRPDLVVEVISPRPRDVARDRTEKHAQYCAFGVPHYWTVEPLHRTLEIYLRTGTQSRTKGWLWEYQRAELATDGIVSPLVGPVFDVGALWRDLD